MPETKTDFTLLNPPFHQNSLNNSQNNVKWDICSLKTNFFFRPTYLTEANSKDFFMKNMFVHADRGSVQVQNSQNSKVKGSNDLT